MNVLAVLRRNPACPVSSTMLFTENAANSSLHWLDRRDTEPAGAAPVTLSDRFRTRHNLTPCPRHKPCLRTILASAAIGR